MSDFKKIDRVGSTKNIIKDVFGVELDISGGWGYNASTSISINSLSMPLEQFLNLFTTIRANIEMNLSLEKDKRYAGIKVTIKNRSKIEVDDITYDVIETQIKAMKEDIYSKFIKEYKEKYGEEGFDLNEYFNRREENTTTRVVEFWFNTLEYN